MPPPPPDDAWLETILREQQSSYIDDAGFTARVVATLPRRERRRMWLLTIATVVGCAIAGWFGATASVELIANAGDSLVRQIDAYPLAPTYVLLGASLLLGTGSAWWALARRR